MANESLWKLGKTFLSAEESLKVFPAQRLKYFFQLKELVKKRNVEN